MKISRPLLLIIFVTLLSCSFHSHNNDVSKESENHVQPNFPNPFSPPPCYFDVHVKGVVQVKVDLLDSASASVASLFDSVLDQDTTLRFIWEGHGCGPKEFYGPVMQIALPNLRSGVYRVRTKIGDSVAQQRIFLLE